MTDRELMQQALDAMLNFPNDISDEMFESIRALRARLAQPEQEPVAQVDYNERGNIQWLFGKQIPDKTFLYTAPPQREWQGLTDEEYTMLIQQADHDAAKTGSVFQNLRHAIEAKLKEKNNDN